MRARFYQYFLKSIFEKKDNPARIRTGESSSGAANTKRNDVMNQTEKDCIGGILKPLLVGGITFVVFDGIFDLVNIFGSSDSYVYYYAFSTIVQGFFAFVAFLGMLAIYKLQRLEDLKKTAYDEYETRLEEDHRNLTRELKKISIICLFDVGLALIGIPLIPYFSQTTFSLCQIPLNLGPIYLGWNIALSVWVLRLSYSIIQKVLQPTSIT